MQQQLLRRLQQQGVMGAPLVQWLKGYAARIQQGTAPIVDLQEDHLLDQVCVVEKWSKEISPLLRLEHSRQVHVVQPLVLLVCLHQWCCWCACS